MKTKILLVENIHPVAQERLEKDGYSVDLIKDSPSEKDLIKMLSQYQALGIRSKTEMTDKVKRMPPLTGNWGFLHRYQSN